MATAVYVLCALTSVGCAVLLLRAWRRGRERLLLWSALCFAWLAANNILLFVDRAVVTDVDLRWARSTTALTGLLFLLYGLVWDTLRRPRA
jgi:hypothetical protein